MSDNQKIINPHPGEILREEFLEPLNMTPSQLARALRVPASRITAIVREKRSITADTALRLEEYFGSSVEFWLNLQRLYDLRKLRPILAYELSQIHPNQQIESHYVD